MSIFLKTHSQLALALFCTPFICCGCGQNRDVPPAVTQVDSERTIAPNSVGEYGIGVSTLQDILGSDTAETRKTFSDKGLNFEFEQGRELIGITVSSNDYALENGLSVGSKAQDVRDKLGEPNETQIELEPKQIKLDALVYREYTFLLDESDRVTAIRVGR